MKNLLTILPLIILSIIPQIKEYSIYIYSALTLVIIDSVIKILSLYINNKTDNIKSKTFLIGIVLKFIFISILLLFALLINTLFNLDIFSYVFIIYLAYEIKSIDENIKEITRKSIIDSIINALLFFIRTKNKLNNADKNDNN